MHVSSKSTKVNLCECSVVNITWVLEAYLGPCQTSMVNILRGIVFSLSRPLKFYGEYLLCQSKITLKWLTWSTYAENHTPGYHIVKFIICVTGGGNRYFQRESGQFDRLVVFL